MSSDERHFDWFDTMSEEELEAMLLEDYDPSTDLCELLWPVMMGVFAQELAELAMTKGDGKVERMSYERVAGR